MKRSTTPSSRGSSRGRGKRLRLTLLLATAAAFLLVPAAQAFANSAVTVEVEGNGSGEVSSVGGIQGGPIPFLDGLYPGTPPIECSYDGKAASGICADTMTNEPEFESESIALHAVPATGSEFAGWTVVEGEPQFEGSEFEEPEPLCAGEGSVVKGYLHQCIVGGLENSAPEAVLVAKFVKTGATNLRLLTLTKSAGGSGGIGSVSSKPKGINCGTACSSADASMYEGSTVTLTEKPGGTSSHFVEWTGACTGSGTTCTVTMNEAKSVGAVFGGESKAIANPQTLTLAKAGTGYGTVKAAGLACESECTETKVDYQGPTGVAPKNKPGKTVTLTETAAFGSEFTGWSGCESEPVVIGKGTECVVAMEEAKSVTASFTARANETLTLNKGGTGNGSISSKPKAVNCGTTCTTQSASVPKGEAIVLKEKPGSGMTFTGWSGGGCSGTGETCTVSLSGAESVTASFSGTPKEIPNAKGLTLTKAGSGFGTVKAAGLTCEVLCTSTVSLYQGPTGVAPKNKPGKTVTLVATSAPGSTAVAWSGCESEPVVEGKGTECVVTMEEAKSVTATFNELP